MSHDDEDKMREELERVARQVGGRVIGMDIPDDDPAAQAEGVCMLLLQMCLHLQAGKHLPAQVLFAGLSTAMLTLWVGMDADLTDDTPDDVVVAEMVKLTAMMRSHATSDGAVETTRHLFAKALKAAGVTTSKEEAEASSDGTNFKTHH